MFSRKRLNGYLTVEASVLVPLAFFLAVFVIHTSFFMYGRCVLVQDNYLLAMRAANLPEGEDRAAFVTGKASGQTSGHFYGNDEPSVSVSVTSKEVITTASGRAKRSGYDLADEAPFASASRAKASILNPPAHIRRVDRLYDIAERQLKGGNE